MQETLKKLRNILKKALELNPENLFARERLINLYLSQKSYGEAIKELETLKEQKSEVEQIHEKLALLYFQTKQYDKAIEELEYLLRKKSKGHESHVLSILNLH